MFQSKLMPNPRQPRMLRATFLWFVAGCAMFLTAAAVLPH
jgi:hypothetical protein